MSVAEQIENGRKLAGYPAQLSELPYSNIGDLLRMAVAKYADKPVLSSLGRTLTYAELDRLSAQFAAYLQQHTDLEPGDRIAIQMPNLIQYPVAFFGAIRAGLVVVNTNPLYTAREMEHQFNDSGAKALVILANMAATAQTVLPRTGIRHVIITELADLHPPLKRLLVNAAAKYIKKLVPPYRIAGALTFTRALALGAGRSHREANQSLDELAVLQYTGGTTGVSKGAMLSHRNVVANVAQAGVLFESVDFIDGAETLLLPLPLYHIYAFNSCMCMMSRGGHVVLIPNPRDLNSVVDGFEQYNITCFAGLNTLFVALCNNPRFRELDFSRLKSTTSGGMALTQDAAKRWHEVTGVEITEGYGLSETSPVVSVNPATANRIGTIGCPVPSTEIRLLDNEGNEVAVGEAGELCVRGPQVMMGYWQRDDETAKVMTEDGFFMTGDIAIVTDEGYLKIVDRKKDMIVVSGFNVYPNEIEDVVVSHPDVIECAAVGVPDARTGEAVKVFVVSSNPALSEADLQAWCRETLTGYKVPKQFVFRDDLPKSNVGKILRRELRDQN